MLVFIDYKYLTVGGAPQLESNIIFGLNKRGLNAKVYCSKNSYLYERLTNHGATFIHVDSDVVPFYHLGDYIDHDDVVCVTSVGSSLLLYSNRNKVNRIFFYSIHPDTFFSTDEWIKKIPLYKYRIFGLLNVMFQKDGIFFMDGPNVKGLTDRAYQIPVNAPKYIPVPDISESGLRRSNYSIGDICRCTYIGRGSEDWKVYPVIKILEDLNGIDKKFSLTIITDVNDLFQSMIEQYIPNNRVDVEYINGLSGKDMEKYLYENSDIHFSMGIAALDGAKLGIPTILCDASHHKFPDTYKYKWMFDAKDYSLADFINDETEFSGYSMSEVVNSICDKSIYLELSEKCYKFVESNHSLDNTIDKILEASQTTKLTALDYCRTAYMKRTLWLTVLVKIKYEITKRF